MSYAGSPVPQSEVEIDELAELEAAARRALGNMGGDKPAAIRPMLAGATVVRLPTKRQHRFVRDGEVPVERVNGLRGRAPLPDQEALQSAQAALSVERSVRTKAERNLGLAQETVRDAQAQLSRMRLSRDAALSQIEVEHVTIQRMQARLAARDSEIAHLSRQFEAVSARHREAEDRLSTTPARPAEVAEAPVAPSRDGFAAALAAAGEATRAIAASRKTAVARMRMLSARRSARA